MNDGQSSLLDESVSTLPSVLIENILWRLPTEEVVRASILSKEWRYSWTKIPKVSFHEDLFDESTTENQLDVNEQEFEDLLSEKEEMRRSKFFKAINQFLLLHQGPIIDFTVCMYLSDLCIDCAELNQILHHLSRKNTVKKLCLRSSFVLPLSIFSFHQLTDLHLCNCEMYKPPTFNGFGSLTTLCLEHVKIHKDVLMHILSNNPLIKSFTIFTGDDSSIQKLHQDEYGFVIEDYADITVEDHGTFDELFQLLPVIEDLTLTVWEIESFVGGVVPQKLATSLLHLKNLRLEGMSFLNHKWLRILVLMITSSPNLEKLTLEITFEDTTTHWENFDRFLYSVTMQDCSDIWLQHLIELELVYNFNENDIMYERFVKLIRMEHLIEDENEDIDNTEYGESGFVNMILAKSPVLKKLRLSGYYEDAKLKLVEAFLSPPPASPMLEIIGSYDEVICICESVNA
ncbi:F-box/FBD/LRR-repeat protein At1g13570-like [Rutidosis leptorrhynchoides]|uniref:F-box/FBD/LRR-repeat protein At1g13570-like n=1 Tax=Rutidosis leptorrhynchoides TaxID=125765 RepID=UPI003A995B32